jgi:hypothetical protein
MLTAETFSRMVERFATQHSVSHLDAIQHLCDSKQIDYDSVPRLLTPDLKHRIKVDAVNRNMLTIKKDSLPSELPLD